MARQAPIVGRILAITTLLVILGAAVVSAYKPGFSRAAIATGGQDILYAHDTHPVSAVSAILGSAATAGGCTPLRAGPGGAAGCGGADLVISLINRAGAKTGQFRFGTPANDVGLGIAWNRADGLLYVLGKSNGQHWLAVFYLYGGLKSQTFIGAADPSGARFALTNLFIDNSGSIFFGGHTSINKAPNGCTARASFRVDLDILVCKLNRANLSYAWCRYIGGGWKDTMVATGGTGIAFDTHGNIFVGGNTVRTVPGGVNLGGTDGVIAKLDANGNIVWVKQYGSAANDVAVAVGVDTYADVAYLAGNTAGSVPGDYQRGGGDWFLFQVKSSDGSRIWSKQYGGRGNDVMTDMAIYHQRVFFVGTIPSQLGDWVPYWSTGNDPKVPKNVPNGGLRTYYNSELRGGRDVQVCEIAMTGPATNVPTDWTLIPTGMIKWCSIYGSDGDDTTASLRIQAYDMYFPWTSAGAFQTNEGTEIPSVGGRDVGFTKYWEYDPPPFSATEKTGKDPAKPVAACVRK